MHRELSQSDGGKPCAAESWAVAGLLLVAAALRAWIVVRGGQFYWPDESRYDEARSALAKMLAGEGREAWQDLLSRPEHLFFKVVGLVPAALEQMWGIEAPQFAAGFFACFSVFALVALTRLVRRLGGGTPEVLWTLGLSVGSATLLYYSRHLLPYDLALFLGLCAWCAALGRGIFASGVCGVLAGLCFLTYNAYWVLGGAAMIAAALSGATWRERGGRAAVAAIGLSLPLVGLLWAGAALGVPVLATAGKFSTTIVAGDLGHGGRLIIEYFWHAEKFFAVAAAAGALVGVVLGRQLPPLMRVSLGAGAGILGVLWFLDSGIDRFVVYGRSVRQAVPFFWIAIGAGLAAWWRQRPAMASSFAGVLFVLAAIGLAPVLTQWFPAEFRREAAKLRAARAAQGDTANYQTAFASFYFTPVTIPQHPPPGEVLWRRKHPFEYPPYLYEGASAADRAAFRERDFSMRLVALGTDEQGRGWRGNEETLARHQGYPGAVRLTLRFPPERVGAYEPLVVTGESGQGDLLYVIYQDSAHVRIGFDHWGIGGTLSDPIPVEWGRPVEVEVSMGSLFPPDAPAEVRRRLRVRWDGRPILDQAQEFHPSGPGSVMFGLNLIGGGTAHAQFTGVIEAIEPVAE